MENKLKTLPQPVLWLLLTLTFTVSAMLTVYYPVLFNIPINVILPLFLILKFKCVFFERMKLATLIIIRALILLPLFGIMNGDTFIVIVIVFMGINIMEAGFTDLLKAKQIYNFISGVALAVACVYLRNYYWIDDYNGILSHSRYSMGNSWPFFAWVVSYTIWNWIFVAKEFKPAIALMHLGTLSAPLLGVGLWALFSGSLDIGLWFALRANSLTCCGIIQVFKKAQLEEALATTRMNNIIKKVQTTKVQIILMIINVALAMVPVIAFYR